MTDRVKRLRKRFRSATTDGNKLRCAVEHAHLVTEFYQQHKFDAPIIKRAKLMKYLCENVTMRIWNDRLIVGNLSPEYHGSILWPELGIDWLFKELIYGYL